jgi:O-antigen ligase
LTGAGSQVRSILNRPGSAFAGSAGAALGVIVAVVATGAMLKLGIKVPIALAVVIGGGVLALRNPKVILHGAILIAIAAPPTLSLGNPYLLPARLSSIGAITFIIYRSVAGANRKRNPFGAIEWSLIAYLVVLAVSMLTASYSLKTTLVFDILTPFAFVFALRNSTDKEALEIQRVILIAATLGAIAVMIEYFAGTKVFGSLEGYGGTAWKGVWAGSDTKAFRPSGIWNGPPVAGQVLGCCLMMTTRLWWPNNVRRVGVEQAAAGLLLVASFVTFTRATFGVTLLALLVVFIAGTNPTRRAARAGKVAAAVLVALIFLAPVVTQTNFYQKAFGRTDSLSSRQSFLNAAVNVEQRATAGDIILGHGVGQIKLVRSDPTTSLSGDLGRIPWVTTYGVHNQFMYLVIEIGLAGVAAMLAFLVSSGLTAYRYGTSQSGRRRLEAVGLVGSVMIFAVTMWFNETNSLGSWAPLAMTAGFAAALRSRPGVQQAKLRPSLNQ